MLRNLVANIAYVKLVVNKSPSNTEKIGFTNFSSPYILRDTSMSRAFGIRLQAVHQGDLMEGKPMYLHCLCNCNSRQEIGSGGRQIEMPSLTGPATDI